MMDIADIRLLAKNGNLGRAIVEYRKAEESDAGLNNSLKQLSIEPQIGSIEDESTRGYERTTQ